MRIQLKVYAKQAGQQQVRFIAAWEGIGWLVRTDREQLIQCRKQTERQTQNEI